MSNTITLHPPAARPSGSQRLRKVAVRLAVEPRELAHRLRHSRCALCRVELSYVRRYFEHHHTCEACESHLDAEVVGELRELEGYL